MGRRRVADDFTPEAREEMHKLVDFIVDNRLSGVIAAKEIKGGFLYRIFGNKKTVRSLIERMGRKEITKS